MVYVVLSVCVSWCRYFCVVCVMPSLFMIKMRREVNTVEKYLIQFLCTSERRIGTNLKLAVA